MVNLTQFLIGAEPELTNWIGKLVDALYQGVHSFGWTVVIFTIILKVILSPLDIWQKRTMLKNNRAMKIIAPELEKLKKTYANAPDVLQQKQMELYKKNGYSMLGGCLPAIITIVIFFVVFSGFNAAVRYENELIVWKLTAQYEEIVADTSLTDEEIDAKMVAAYDEHKESWLWIKNVFISDTYANPVPTQEKFVGRGLGQLGGTLPEETRLLNVGKSQYDNGYDAVMMPAISAYEKSGFFDMKHWNGYFILPFISILLSIFSVKLSKTTQPAMPEQTDENAKNGQGMMKVMNWLMPIMMGVFALFYSAAFCIYMVMNSLITVIFNLVYNRIAKKQDAKLEEERLAATFKKGR